jgi:hypothetical protein
MLAHVRKHLRVPLHTRIRLHPPARALPHLPARANDSTSAYIYFQFTLRFMGALKSELGRFIVSLGHFIPSTDQ